MTVRSNDEGSGGKCALMTGRWYSIVRRGRYSPSRPMPSAGNKPILRVFADVEVVKVRRKMLEAMSKRLKDKGESERDRT